MNEPSSTPTLVADENPTDAETAAGKVLNLSVSHRWVGGRAIRITASNVARAVDAAQEAANQGPESFLPKGCVEDSRVTKNPVPEELEPEELEPEMAHEPVETADLVAHAVAHAVAQLDVGTLAEAMPETPTEPVETKPAKRTEPAERTEPVTNLAALQDEAGTQSELAAAFLEASLQSQPADTCGIAADVLTQLDAAHPEPAAPELQSEPAETAEPAEAAEPFSNEAALLEASTQSEPADSSGVTADVLTQLDAALPDPAVPEHQSEVDVSELVAAPVAQLDASTPESAAMPIKADAQVAGALTQPDASPQAETPPQNQNEAELVANAVVHLVSTLVEKAVVSSGESAGTADVVTQPDASTDGKVHRSALADPFAEVEAAVAAEQEKSVDSEKRVKQAAPAVADPFAAVDAAVAAEQERSVDSEKSVKQAAPAAPKPAEAKGSGQRVRAARLVTSTDHVHPAAPETASASAGNCASARLVTSTDNVNPADPEIADPPKKTVRPAKRATRTPKKTTKPARRAPRAPEPNAVAPAEAPHAPKGHILRDEKALKPERDAAADAADAVRAAGAMRAKSDSKKPQREEQPLKRALTAASEAADEVRSSWALRARPVRRPEYPDPRSAKARRSEPSSRSGQKGPRRSRSSATRRSPKSSSDSGHKRPGSRAATAPRSAEPTSDSGQKRPDSRAAAARRAASNSGQKRPDSRAARSKSDSRHKRPSQSSRSNRAHARRSPARQLSLLRILAISPWLVIWRCLWAPLYVARAMTTSWVRLALVLVAVGSAAFYFSPEGETVVASIESSVRSATQEQSIQPETENAPTARRADTARSAAWAAAWAALAAPPLPTEICEFLARPAARLYIDGKLVSKEIPPIFRTELAIGEHTVRFVSVTNRTRELRIQVVEGSPTRWVMNWVENRVGQRSLDRHEELGG